jgi:GNAT superfamily N-acetyltransferase
MSVSSPPRDGETGPAALAGSLAPSKACGMSITSHLELRADLAGDGVVFEPRQLARHQAIFATGQFVAEENGAILGAIATLRVPSAFALAPHTWAGITADGTFASHVETGDALYLADVYVDPKAWGKGVGAALYAELFAMCRRVGCKRVVAGGRLWGYHLAADRLSPAQYVDEVVRGLRKDKVLGSQLRAGFTVQGILDGYLLDARSRSFATLLVWTNPTASDAVRPSRSLPKVHASDGT